MKRFLKKILIKLSRNLKRNIPAYLNTFVICVTLLFATTVAKVTVQTQKPCSALSPLARSENKQTIQQEGSKKTAELSSDFILVNVCIAICIALLIRYIRAPCLYSEWLTIKVA